MTTSRLLKQGLRAMTRYKLRTGFMMLSCLVGVAALTLVVSVGSGAERKILQTVSRLFSASSIFVTSGGNILASGSRGEGSRLTLADVEAIAAALPAVEVWDPLQVQDPAEVRSAERAATVRLVGASERTERVWERAAARGEYFAAADVARSARVALIGTTVERTLFAGTDPVGAEIQVGGVSLRVIGVLESMGTDAHGLDRDNEVLVPISTMMRRLMNVDTIRGAKLLVKDPSLAAATAVEVGRMLRERHGIAPGGQDDFTIVTPTDVQRMVGKAQRVMFVFLPLVAAIALLAGGVVAASLMLLSVGARVGEIGLRRALGARPRDIALQFLCESAVTTFSGGVTGILLGATASLLVARRLGLEAFFSWKAALLGLALSLLVGLLAGVVPARRAARLRPADALR
jgi:putative ABC transport system permease protein